MTMFQDYLLTLRKSHSVVLDRVLFSDFSEKYPDYTEYYNHESREFDHEGFLKTLLENNVIDPNSTMEFKGKVYNLTHLYMESLLSNGIAYNHIVYCLPKFLKKVKVATFFNYYLKVLLAEPYINNIEYNGHYIGIQALFIDAINAVYPFELKNLLKDYKFDTIESTPELLNNGKIDYSLPPNLQLKNYHGFLKHMCTTLQSY